MMPGMDGMQLLERIKGLRPDVEVIMMSATASLETAISAKKAGAYTFLRKPFELNDSLVLSIIMAAEHRSLPHHVRALEERLDAKERFGDLIGTSKEMLDVYRIIDGVANTHSTILILGESGTGKELVARAIHANSPAGQGAARRPGTARPSPRILVESDLFGHVRGAFTGAQTARAGVFEAASTGTLFLDEVGDLLLPAQASLLRVLQEGEIKRVGSDETKTVDVRGDRRHQTGRPQEQDRDGGLPVGPVLPPQRHRGAPSGPARAGDDVLLLADHSLLSSSPVGSSAIRRS